jgi:hypothetical protein
MPRRASARVPWFAYTPRDRHLAPLARLSAPDASRDVARIAIDDVAVPTGVAVRHAAALGVIRARAHRRALRAHDSATTRAKSVALTIPTGSRALQTTTRRARRSATCAATGTASCRRAGRSPRRRTRRRSTSIAAGRGWPARWPAWAPRRGSSPRWRAGAAASSRRGSAAARSAARRGFARRPRCGGCAGPEQTVRARSAARQAAMAQVGFPRTCSAVPCAHRARPDRGDTGGWDSDGSAGAAGQSLPWDRRGARRPGALRSFRTAHHRARGLRRGPACDRATARTRPSGGRRDRRRRRRAAAASKNRSGGRGRCSDSVARRSRRDRDAADAVCKQRSCIPHPGRGTGSSGYDGRGT